MVKTKRMNGTGGSTTIPTKDALSRGEAVGARRTKKRGRGSWWISLS